MKTIFMMNLNSILSILFVLFIRRIFFYKTTKKIWLWFWRILFLRLAVPLFFPVAFHIKLHQAVPVIGYMRAGITRTDTPMILAVLWGAGFFFCLFYYLTNYRKDYKTLQEAVPMENSMYREILQQYTDQNLCILQSDKIGSPLTYCILRPKIVLPKSEQPLGLQEASYIFIHEISHIKNQDNFWKPFSVFMCCIYWYNPFIWIMHRFMVKDMEFAADENVIAILGKGERKGYAETLLQYQISRRSQIAGNKFAENIVKERILSIMKYNKKNKLFVPLCAAALGIGILSFVSPQVKAEPAAGEFAADVSIAAVKDETPETSLSTRIEQVKEGKITGEATEMIAEELHEENRKMIAEYENVK